MTESARGDTSRCERCGAEFVPSASPLGACPACLLEAGSSNPSWTPPSLSSVVVPVPPPPQPTPVRRWWRASWVKWLAAGALILIGIAFFRVGPRGVESVSPLSSVVRFALPLPDGTNARPGAQFAVSPDGTRIVLAARGADGRRRLWLRQLQSLEWRELAATDGAALPFWSPDSRHVGFFAGRILRRIDLSNDLIQTLCDAPAGRGATWASHGVIVFASAAGPLLAVLSGGGTPHQLSSVDPPRGGVAHLWPQFLPDGQHVLFTESRPRSTQDSAATALYVLSLTKGERKLVVEHANAGLFVQGFLLFTRGASLMAQPFDVSRTEVTGDIRTVSGVEPLVDRGSEWAGVSASAGVLVHQKRDQRGGLLAWTDRNGRTIGVVGEPRNYEDFSLSPDERQIAITVRDERDDAAQLRLMELDRGVTSRLTIGSSGDASPVWFPDGRRIFFVSGRDAVQGIHAVAASGGAAPEAFYQSRETVRPTHWSPDGQLLLFTAESTTTGSDLWVLRADGDRKPNPFLQTPFNESDARFSPDGRFVAYVSDETGRDEVYVRTFPGPGERWQVSDKGGNRPRWNGSGRELYFVSAEGLLVAVDVQSGPTLRIGAPRALFAMHAADSYDVSHDGQRFLMTMPSGDRAPQALQLVLNWAAEIGREPALSLSKGFRRE